MSNFDGFCAGFFRKKAANSPKRREILYNRIDTLKEDPEQFINKKSKRTRKPSDGLSRLLSKSTHLSETLGERRLKCVY
ncbi:MAG: hypothetical protein AAF696_06580 [Bacteroidota bacterium]